MYLKDHAAVDPLKKYPACLGEKLNKKTESSLRSNHCFEGTDIFDVEFRTVKPRYKLFIKFSISRDFVTEKAKGDLYHLQSTKILHGELYGQYCLPC